MESVLPSGQQPPREQAQAGPQPEASTEAEGDQDTQTTAGSAVVVEEPTIESVPTSQDTTAPPQPRLQRQLTEGSIRKCWICYGDETEDGPGSSPWRRPCICSLTAHEDCLLGWEANIHNDNLGRYRDNPKGVECPQCKTPIQVVRPAAYSAELVRFLDRQSGRLVLPVLGLAIAGTLWAGSVFYGVAAMQMVFGTGDFLRLVGLRDLQPGTKLSTKWVTALPALPWVLIFSRTSFTDPLLAFLPIMLFTKPESVNSGIGASTAWPDLLHPSAAFAFGVLPYVRAGYVTLYRKVFGKKLKEWNQAIQPRLGQEEDAQADQPQNEEVNEEQMEGADVEINLQIEVIEEEIEGEDVGLPPPERQDEANAEEQNHNEQANDNQDNDDRAGHERQGQAQLPPGARPVQVAAQPRNGADRAANNLAGQLIFSIAKIADRTVGALMFPVLATLSGSLLRRALPARLTTLGSSDGRPTLLQSRWGRTIVGGCLFVLLKDSLFTYSRWKLAQTHSKRRIFDYKAPLRR